jgi:hypothetical protein
VSSGRCRVRGDAEGAKNLMGGADRTAHLRQRGRGAGRLLGVWSTLKESESPWVDAEAVETQPGTVLREDPEGPPATAKAERGAPKPMTALA